MMEELQEKKLRGCTFRGFEETIVQSCAFEHKQNHDKAAHEIEGKQPLCRSLDGHNIRGLGHYCKQNYK